MYFYLLMNKDFIIIIIINYNFFTKLTQCSSYWWRLALRHSYF